MMLTIDDLRNEIEQTDITLIQILAKRHFLSKQIGRLKLENGQEVKDPLRENKLYAMYTQLAAQYQLDETFVVRLFKEIIEHSVMVQNNHR